MERVKQFTGPMLEVMVDDDWDFGVVSTRGKQNSEHLGK
jgi:hypothetical protein